MATDAYALQVFKLAGLAEGTAETKAGTTNVGIKHSYPREEDARFLLTRLYETNSILNCARSLDHNLLVHGIVRNAGYTTTNIATQNLTIPLQAGIQFPSPADLYQPVWDLIPGFLKDRIRQWAKDTNMQGTIAREITEYVKIALSALPIPVPAIFVNAVANLVIPPLVQYLVTKLTKIPFQSKVSQKPPMLGYPTTPEIHRVMQKLDRKTLRLAGLPASDLPTHLKADQSDDDSQDDTPYPCLGQPDGRDISVDMKQFYQFDQRNGCKPMALTQLIAAQIRSNPTSDQEPLKFGNAVWNSLNTDDGKKLRKQLKDWAVESPPNRPKISQALYQPVYDLLGTDPYDVPEPIRPSFTSMKVPEVTEWVVDTYGSD